MAESIRELIRKRYPNGRDLGELFVETTVKDIECWRKDKPIKHAYTQEMLNTAFYELPPEDQRLFTTYADIHDTLIAVYDRNQAYLQQFYNGFYRVRYTLDEILRNETFYINNIKFKNSISKELAEEFVGNLKSELLRVANLKKTGRVGEIEKAYALMDDALWDFTACKMYLNIVESLYGLNLKKISDSYFEEAAQKADEVSVLYDKAIEIAKGIEKYFKKIDIESYHLETYDKEKIVKDNSYIKRYKPLIENIKAELKNSKLQKNFGE